MNGVHDMGGMHGFGPVLREENEPLFHADWEARVVAMNRLSQKQGFFNIDEFRYGIEQIDPAHYLRSTYYERWLATVEYNLVQKGLLTDDELDSRTEILRQQPENALLHPEHGSPSPSLPEPAFKSPVTPIEPRFAVGDPVTVNNSHPTGHTRVPRYTRGKHGVIHQVHGPAIFPDTHAHGRGENPRNVYSVRFGARELWGDSAEPNQTLSIDLWESYLEPDPS
jgi:nitrile hydratase